MPDNQIEKYTVKEGDLRYPDVIYRYRADTISGVSAEGQLITFVTENQIVLKLHVLTPYIIRLNYALEGDFVHDFSYAVDPNFKSRKTKYSLEERDDHYCISTSVLICKVMKEKMLVHFYDSDEIVLCEDQHGYYRRESLMNGISEIKLTKKAPDGVRYYGLGDKPFELNLRGKAFENWNTDSFAYERGDDPLYRSIPFYMALIENRGYGIFFDNTYRTKFDFDRRKKGTTSFSAEGGQMNYYFIHGPQLVDVARRYTLLTGTPDLPPMWALGYHQCRWSYFPESRVREIARTFRDKKIPCDAIYLDIDYMDNYKVFTWNREYFPHPQKLIRELSRDGFRTIVMIDPGIRVDHDYTVFEEGMKKGYFCTRPDGDLVIGPVWPPRCVWPDFTNPDVREWWSDLYSEFMDGLNISGIWNDMNEPAVFEVESKTFPEDIRHQYDGHPCSHKKAHNIYGMQMTRGSLQGIKKHQPGKRPFLLSRASFSGGQRYAALWTGDNIATWDHLRLANEQCMRLSISGFSFCGSDIGGFAETPTSELYIRWLQLGIFHPLYRTHSMGFNVDGAAAVQQEAKDSVEETGDQEPWSFGKNTTRIARHTIELRYRLLYYLYTAFHKYVTDGTPLLQPLVFYDQDDISLPATNDEFMFGEQIMVSPVLKKGQKKKQVYLPKGEWYHFWDDNRLGGQQKHTVETPLDQIPFFVKSGTVLPLRELMQYTSEKKPEKMTLQVYHGPGDTTSQLYEDAEEGYGYKDGEYLKTGFKYEHTQQQVRITAAREGTYEPTYDETEILFIGLPFAPGKCTIDGENRKPERVQRNGKTAWRVHVAPDFSEVIISP